MKITNTIICGFAGIGKSYLAKYKETFVDLESTPFNKNWDIYTDVAIHMQKNGYTPMVACHKDLRLMLKSKKAKYIVVIPKKEHKDEYIKRYKERGNNKAFLEFLSSNWDKFIDEVNEEEENVVTLQSSNETLSDILHLVLK